MHDPTLYLAFVLAVVVLAVIPGPNMALIVANSVAYGTRFGMLTLLGTTSAMVPQLLLTALGLTAVLGALGGAFEWLRWLGVFYLLWLGVSHWRAEPLDLSGTRPQPRSARRIYARALLVSLTNPKTLLFFSAFFPQFIDPAAPAGRQVALLSVTFVVVVSLIDSVWALLAGRARMLLSRHGRLRNRVTGGLLVGAGLGLALARRR